MPFRLRRDARDWFKDIRSSFDLDFDSYYFCLMAGLAKRRKEEVTQAETTELVDEFPLLYRPKRHLVLSLFLSRELKELGIKLTERVAIHAEIQKLVEPLAASKLSDVGMREINKYSNGGFEILSQDWFEDRPRSIETFLPLYKKKLSAALADEG